MKTAEKTAVATSFLVTSLLGVSFVYSFWASSSLAMAWQRSGLFVVAIAGVHFLGFVLYTNQAPSVATNPVLTQSGTEEETSKLTLLPFLPAILIQQISVLVLAALLLDGGMSFHRSCLGVIGHWTCIAAILIGRRNCATRIDEFIMKWGFIPLTMLIGVLDDAFH